MDIKKRLGNKIRFIRNNNGMSREELCETEENLTIRQLGRIETGVSLPTLPKLTYIANRLEVPLTSLIDDTKMTLSEEYIQLKYKLYREPIYGNKTKLENKEDILDVVYEKFYEFLPEEEQLIINALSSTIDVHTTKNTQYGIDILEEYFFQLEYKSSYEENDLLILFLFFHSYTEYDIEVFHKISINLLEQINLENKTHSYLLLKNIIAILNILMFERDYSKFPLFIKAAETIMENNYDFQKKPIINMLDAKYQLFYVGNKELAIKKYTDASQLALLLLNDEHLQYQIKTEFDKDLTLYDKSS